MLRRQQAKPLFLQGCACVALWVLVHNCLRESELVRLRFVFRSPCSLQKALRNVSREKCFQGCFLEFLGCGSVVLCSAAAAIVGLGLGCWRCCSVCPGGALPLLLSTVQTVLARETLFCALPGKANPWQGAGEGRQGQAGVASPPSCLHNSCGISPSQAVLAWSGAGEAVVCVAEGYWRKELSDKGVSLEPLAYVN